MVRVALVVGLLLSAAGCSVPSRIERRGHVEVSSTGAPVQIATHVGTVGGAPGHRPWAVRELRWSDGQWQPPR